MISYIYTLQETRGAQSAITQLRHAASNPTFPDDDSDLSSNQTILPHSESFAYGMKLSLINLHR